MPSRSGDTEAGDIPIVGRPTDLPFSEASGTFIVSAHAEPTSVQAERPLVLTVVVEADGPVFHPPQRIDLRQIDEFTERFYIEDLNDDPAAVPDARRWQFAYRLKPRRSDVSDIPSVPFVYYNPVIRPANKAFQVKYTDAIPIQVQSAAVMEPKPGPLADLFLQVHGGPALLARQTPWTPPSLSFIAVMLATPPLLCAAWYLVWRSRNPTVVKQRERRRSAAARQALALLQQAELAAVEKRAELTAAALATYLHQRVELTVAEPTPAETAAFLQRKGCSPTVIMQTVSLLQSCDAARYWPRAILDRTKLPALATAVILALDADTAAPHQPVSTPQTEGVP